MRLPCDPGPPVRGRGENEPDGTGGQAEQELGRSRGGFGTTTHAAGSGLGRPPRRTLSPGPDADITRADALPDGATPAVVIADTGYDKPALVDATEAKGGEAVIPTRSNRTVQRDIAADRYKDRNLVERFWAKVKQYRRVATRYEKPARNFMSFVQVSSIMILLQ